MAFGRSNSLSINTTSTNSLFGKPAEQGQAQPATNLFGANTAKPSGLFGSTGTMQSQPSNNLFGNTNTNTNTSNAPSTSLFGNTTTNTSNAPTTSLFGNTTTNTNNAPTTSLFGNTNTNTNNAPTTSLFGGAPATTAPQQNTSLFGNAQNTMNTATNGLFGGIGQTQNNGLFGNSQAAKPATTSLFGNNTFAPAGSNMQQSQQQQQQQPSLLGASLFNNSVSIPVAPLAGSLTMGQQNINAANTIPGVRIDISNLRPTTRFSDLHDELKNQIEAVDTFIKSQESFASQCEAMLPQHADNVASIGPDVEFITSRCETVELGLENDSTNIQAAKDLLRDDKRNLLRCARVIENQALPGRFHYAPTLGSTSNANGGMDNSSDHAQNRQQSGSGALEEDDHDVDILAYFARQAQAMQNTLSSFQNSLSEIEDHLSIVERGAASLIQDVSRERSAGGSGRLSGQDTLSELASTLRGFEGGILDAAGKIGSCREGVNTLVARAGGMEGRY